MDDESERRVREFMTTEHFVLQTARSMTIQEANGRANLFLTSLSSAVVALALVGQVTKLGQSFVLFSLVMLPCLWFMGVVTFGRLVQVGIEDMLHARGMARIRHYFVEAAPEMARYMMHSTHDDYYGLLADMGRAPSANPSWRSLQSFLTTSGMVSVIDSVLAGVFVGLSVHALLGWPTTLALACAILAFVVNVVLFRRLQARAWKSAEGRLETLFPTGAGA
jgi:hypothetical protein